MSFQSYLNNRPEYYYGDSERTKQRRRSEKGKAANLTGQDLFAAWGIAKSAEESIVPIVRAYNKTSHTNEDILNALGLIMFMRKAYTKCCRYIDAYRVGLSATQAEFAVKKYKSHRSIPAEFLRDLK